MGIDSQVACPVDEPIDDYESWDGELPEAVNKDKMVLCVPNPQNFRTE